MGAVAATTTADLAGLDNAGRTHGPLFVSLLVGTILIVGGIIYLPALALGPVAEQFVLQVHRLYRA